MDLSRGGFPFEKEDDVTLYTHLSYKFKRYSWYLKGLKFSLFVANRLRCDAALPLDKRITANRTGQSHEELMSRQTAPDSDQPITTVCFHQPTISWVASTWTRTVRVVHNTSQRGVTVSTNAFMAILVAILFHLFKPFPEGSTLNAVNETTLARAHFRKRSTRFNQVRKYVSTRCPLFLKKMVSVLDV